MTLDVVVPGTAEFFHATHRLKKVEMALRVGLVEQNAAELSDVPGKRNVTCDNLPVAFLLFFDLSRHGNSHLSAFVDQPGTIFPVREYINCIR